MTAALISLFAVVLGLQAPAGPIRVPDRVIYLAPPVDKPVIQVARAPIASIRGRITLDDTRRPIAGIRVSLLMKTYSEDGTMTPAVVTAVETNSGGEYTVAVVSPGRYYLGTASRGPNGSIYLPAFFPGVTSFATAAPVDIRIGDDLTDVDLALFPGKPVTVRGKFIDGLGRRIPHLDRVWLSSLNPSGMNPALGGAGTVPGIDRRIRYENAQEYEIPGVLPGSYYLMSWRFDDVEHRAETAVPIEVRDTDITVDVVSEASFDLNGRIRFEGPGVSLFPPEAGRPAFGITVRSLNDVPVSVPLANLSPGGAFSFLPLPEGSFRLAILNVPPPFYVKSARMGGVDVLTKGIELPRPTAESIEIVIAADGGQITGVVHDRNQKLPAPDSVVVVIPESRGLLRPDLYKTSSTDMNGQFSISGIAPGIYRIYARKELPARAYFDTGFVKRFEEQGTKVEVTAAGLVTVQLNLVEDR